MTKDNILDFLGISLEDIKSVIEKSTDLKDDKSFFYNLSLITKYKNLVKDALEGIEKLEKDTKGLINARAKALYGDDWQVIDGNGFSITRSRTGEIYTINGEPNKKFVIVKKSVDSKAVEDFILENEKLPAGIELSDKRGESLRITLK